jgi:WD40 repeat protein
VPNNSTAVPVAAAALYPAALDVDQSRYDGGCGMPRPERVLDPLAGPVQQFASDLRQLRQKAGNQGYRDLARVTGYSASTLSDAAGGRRLPGLPVVRAYVTACGGDLEDWERRWRLVAATLAARDASTQRPPYLGLASFQQTDADRFFGRARLVGELVEQVTRDGMLAIVGASGCGKSSLLRAGLLPALATGDHLLITPGTEPFTAAGAALSAQPPPALILVDQFEELFTVCRDPVERDRFIGALLDAQQQPGTKVIIAMRADFYGHCAPHHRLAAALRGSTVLIGPMSADELREVVTGPAALAGLTVERALLTKVVDDAAGQPGALPLVSHALLETWLQRQGQILTVAGYEAAGGVAGAIAQTAERVYGGLDRPKQEVARQILTRLTALGEGTQDTRRRIPRSELTFERTAEVLDELVRARLVVADEGTVEIAHEALINAWPRLAGWLREDRDGLRTHRRLSEAATIWRDLRREPGALYRGARLALAREWAERGGNERALTGLERAFLEESVAAEMRERAAAERRSRHLRMLTTGLAVLLVISAVAGGVAVRLWRTAVAERQLAQSQQLAAQALAVAPTDVASGLERALAAYLTAPTVEARGALLSLAGRPAFTGLLHHSDAVKDVAYSPDGSLLAAAGQNGSITLWDPVRRSRLAVLNGHTATRTIAFGPDSRVLVSGGREGDVIVWDVERRAAARRIAGEPETITAVAVSPDGTLMAAIGEGRQVRIWRIDDGSLVTTLDGHGGQQSDVTFSPDGRHVASAGDDGHVVVWDLASRTRLARLAGGQAKLHAVTYSPDGRLVAAGGEDQDIVLWRADTGQRQGVLRGHTNDVRALAFSPDGARLVSAGYDNVAAIWDVRRRDRQITLTGHTSGLYGITISPDGQTVATAGRDQNVLLWQTDRLPLTGLSHEVLDLWVNRSGDTLGGSASNGSTLLWNATTRKPLAWAGTADSVTAGPAPTAGTDLVVTRSGRSIMLWDAATATVACKFDGHRDKVFSVAEHPARHLLASGGGDDDKTVRIWDLPSCALRTALSLSAIKPPNNVQGLAFAAGGALLVAAIRSGTILAWDTATWTPRYRLDVGAELNETAVSADGKVIAVGESEGGIGLWDLMRGRRIGTLAGHSGPVDAMAYSPDGRMLASGGQDGRVILWDTERNTVLAVLVGHTAAVQTAAWSPTGDLLYTAGADHQVIPWKVRPADAIAEICRMLQADFPDSPASARRGCR